MQSTCDRRSRYQQIIVAAAAFCIGGTATATEVFKWRDADGKVHFGDHPTTVQSETVTIRATPARVDEATRQTRARLMLEDLTKTREQATAARKTREEEAAKRAQECNAARQEQFRLEHANRLFRVDADGERRRLGGAERQTEIEHAREAVTASCG